LELCNEFGSVVASVSQRLILGQNPPQAGVEAFAPINEESNELALDKLVAPLATGPDTFAQKCRDRGLETGVIAAIRATIITAIAVFTFSGEQAFCCLGQTNLYDIVTSLHSQQSNRWTEWIAWRAVTSVEFWKLGVAGSWTERPPASTMAAG
jgi:hypothetical protein